mmetsp:Transcript_15237/g.22414  ORF Transcript_15237/g.22414 Transcript_15237/m.22414 type:complete len:92 (+) Transcript_15237:892-1167(+)
MMPNKDKGGGIGKNVDICLITIAPPSHPPKNGFCLLLLYLPLFYSFISERNRPVCMYEFLERKEGRYSIGVFQSVTNRIIEKYELLDLNGK